jgi:cyclophilin family peptidyl-prolyl cis-trans isomerase
MAPPSRGRRLALSAAGATVVLIAVLIGADVASNTTEEPKVCTEYSEKLHGKTSFSAPPCRFINDAMYDAKLETSLGDINLRLDTRLDGLTVNNFVFLAKVGFYDGITFHRVEADDDHAYVQTGDRSGTGKGTAGYTYTADAPSPITQYVRGMVAMSNTGTLDSTSSQFFIIVRDWDAISGSNVTPAFPFFGFVADAASEAVLDKIVAAPRVGTRPNPPIILKRVTVKEVPFFPEDEQ